MENDLVAVYGSLREGLHNHGVISRHDPEFVGLTRISGFKMHSFGPYPFITHGDGSVLAEVYRVPSTDCADDLDMLEGYPSYYDREQVETEFGTAWVYFIDGETGYPEVPEGDWKEFYTGSW